MSKKYTHWKCVVNVSVKYVETSRSHLLTPCKSNSASQSSILLSRTGGGRGPRGGSKNFGKGVYMYKGVGVRSSDFISFFFKISYENEVIWSQ